MFSGHGTTLSVLGSPTIQGSPGEKKERKGKRKRTIQKDRNSILGDEQVQDPEWWSKKDFAWWSKER